ncbi:hypothetical protein [Cytophaga hutchinsonii]|jgi:hypothetical protein|uniref:Uncharacterized protein n=1 Tax=Cytophaga hutchinsonii (strain ATCC 33406 / DSM 1761 / CIP 103989 / NBRC 15051 / NCIMB 9469 / D465) TaxID=269798 RepID=A0A6N4SMS8_CYTH3|nr:hypothetical protein [Cytophaga hutchinsonii]ABG57572.1 conserved hypothetical protein [Cytophaga hutchinsonii ATCC 33406]SFX00209.1 hypothetical protein SAMN04487930_101135 [Cytophaga hutchinsonii ATCC 33406]
MMLQLSFPILFISGLGGGEIALLLMLLYLVPLVFFILTLKRLLEQLNENNRKVNPVLLWLILIPVVGLVCQFIVVIKMAESLRAEFDQRHLAEEEAKPGFNTGLTYCILFLCGGIPMVGMVLSCVGIYFWISYWIKMNDYKKLLQHM